MYTEKYARPAVKPYVGGPKLDIKDVIFNGPATVVLWTDNTKTIVQMQEGEKEFDPEKAVAMAIAKKAFGNKGSYFNRIRNAKLKYYAQQELEHIQTMSIAEHIRTFTERLNNLPIGYLSKEETTMKETSLNTGTIGPGNASSVAECANSMQENINNTRVNTNYYKFAVIKGTGRLKNFKGEIKAFHILDAGVVAIEFVDGKSAITHMSNVVLYNSAEEVEDE